MLMVLVGPWCPRKILGKRFVGTKVAVWAQKLHELEILKMENFAWTCPNLRATYIFPALPGAARCALASPYGRDMTCRDGFGGHRPSNSIPGRGFEVKFW